MPFLISNGTTNSPIEYVKDLLFLHFNVQKGSVPNNLNIGFNKLIPGLSLNNGKVIIRERVLKQLEIINNSNNLNLELLEFDMDEYNINITINYLNTRINHEIIREL